MEEAAVKVDGGKAMTLVIENCNHHAVWLQKGTELGTLQSVSIADGEEAKPEAPYIAAVTEEGHLDGRFQQLLSALNLQLEHLSLIERKQQLKTLEANTDVFTLDATELGTTEIVSHKIDTGEKLRRIPFSLRKKVDEMITHMLSQGVIAESRSPWASPIVLVRKKDGDLRFCVDYRKLNQNTKLDVFPLPRVDDTLDMLSGNKFFTALDLASGYWQVAVDPESQEKTAFVTYSGLYEFKKMPFGLVNAPATFQRLMEVVLAGLARECWLVHLDDVLVMGRTIEEHNNNLAKVFSRLREAGLKLKPKKCRLAQQEVEYLGHLVTKDGISTDPKKLDAVRNFHHRRM